MNSYKDIIGKINYGLFLVVVALLPFPQLLLRYACGLWMFTWLLELRWLKKPTFVPFHIPFILFGIWFAWLGLSYLWAADHAVWATHMERYLTFGCLLPVAIWGMNTHYNWRTAAKVLVVSCIVAIPFYIGLLTYYYYQDWSQLYLTNPKWDLMNAGWWHFVSENISLFKHRLYLCSIEILGMIMAIQLYLNQPKRLLLILPIMLCAIPLTGSRQAIITLCILLAIGLLIRLDRAKRWRYGIAVILVAALTSGLMLRYHPRMRDFDYRSLTQLHEIDHTHDIRLNVWGFALQHPEDYVAYGLGAGQSGPYLVELYSQKGWDYYVFKHFHAHNQYLEELMELGIGGLLFFILAWLSIPLCVAKQGRPTAILFTTLFLLNMFTDCMFALFCGIALWAFGMLIILLQSDAERKDQSARNTQTH